jgi:hypothetical protein
LAAQFFSLLRAKLADSPVLGAGRRPIFQLGLNRRPNSSPLLQNFCVTRLPLSRLRETDKRSGAQAQGDETVFEHGFCDEFDPNPMRYCGQCSR